MRLIAILTAVFIYQFITAQNTSLKIQTDDSYYYPPNLEFEVLDKKGNAVFTEKDLSQNKPIILKGNYKVNIFTNWGDGKDTFTINDKATIALALNQTYINCDKNEVKSWHKNKPQVIDANFKKNNGEFDTIIAFEKDIFFNYIDGKPSITQDGERLELIGKYVAKTSKGYLKMSYNPETKEYWYVFTDTYNKVVYK